MLYFFRKVRKSLLAASPARKYVLYAIGEIALVVIGILIALQINNWNENRKTQQEVKLYLTNLAEAIGEDIDKHKRMASICEFRFNGYQYLLRISGNDPLELEPLPKDDYPIGIPHIASTVLWPEPYPDTLNREFITLCFRLSVFLEIQNTNQTVYEEMKSVGLFSKINSQSLKKSIDNYYNFCGTYLHESGDWNYRLTTSWQTFLRDNYDFVIAGSQIQTKGDPLNLLEDSRVIVRIQELVNPARFRAINSYTAASQAEQLIADIKNEVDEQY